MKTNTSASRLLAEIHNNGKISPILVNGFLRSLQVEHIFRKCPPGKKDETFGCPPFNHLEAKLH